jgi:hypothetical protein
VFLNRDALQQEEQIVEREKVTLSRGQLKQTIEAETSLEFSKALRKSSVERLVAKLPGVSSRNYFLADSIELYENNTLVRTLPPYIAYTTYTRVNPLATVKLCYVNTATSAPLAAIPLVRTCSDPI